MVRTQLNKGTGPRLDQVKGIMFDVDGCLVLSSKAGGEDGHPLPGAIEVIRELRSAAMPFVAFTNGSSRTPEAISAELRSVGLDVREDEVLTPAVVAARVMLERHPGGRVLAFGGEGITVPLRDAGVDVVDLDAAMADGPDDVAAVVVGWDSSFGRAKIQVAAEALLGGAAFYCTSAAPAFASRGRLNVGVSGFIAAGLQHLSGTPYELVGKPSDEAMATIARKLGVHPSEVLVVGDDLILECSMAVRHGALAVLVTTGMTGRVQAEAAVIENRPHRIIDSMDEFATMLAPVMALRSKLATRR
ncbi:MAG: HAD-superfamily hydrolase, subfamily [Naasia sp.]|nr:HAD-superfamily hydrolase, subfamily [Naasia sp.]